jgi:succinate dehydrogenase / fumarate reductase cytochrome b subunit
VLLLYTVVIALQIVAVDVQPRLYNRLHQIEGNVFVRVLLTLVVLAALFHGLNGVKLVVVESFPRLATRDASATAAVQFLTFACWVPCAFIIMWPPVSEWLT